MIGTGIIVEKVLKIAAKQFKKQFKLDEIKKYVEEPNELDRQVKSLQRSVNKYGQYIEEMEKDIADLKAIKKKLKLFK